MKPKVNKTFFAIDIINMAMCGIMLFLSVFTFLDMDERSDLFPYIILLGSVVNMLSGYKEIKNNNKKGRLSIGIGAVLFILSLVIFSGFGGF